MCGIVGVAGNLSAKEKYMFQVLLELDVYRGRDSTGVVIHKTTGDTEIHKDLNEPWYGLYFNQDFLDSFKSTDVDLLIGHNRAATKGEVTVENAHPFHYGRAWGCHNGTIHDISGLDDHKNFDVDSKALINQIGTTGIEDAVSRVSGPYALVWYDDEDGTVNFIRNSQRPLHFAFSTDNSVLFWASEARTLQYAADTAKMTIGPILEFKEMVHYRIPLPETKVGFIQKAFPKFDKFRVRKLKPKAFVTTTYRRSFINEHWDPVLKRWVDNDIPFEKKGGPDRRVPLRIVGDTKKKTTHKSTNLKKTLKVGDDIIFTIDNFKASGRRPDGFYGYGESASTDLEVRIYPPFNTDKWKQIIEGDTNKFFGRVADIKRDYVKISLKSVIPMEPDKEDEDDEDDEDEMILQWEKEFKAVAEANGSWSFLLDGRYETEQSVRVSLSAGCSCCGGNLPFKDLFKYKWVYDSPVCVTCQEDGTIDRLFC